MLRCPQVCVLSLKSSLTVQVVPAAVKPVALAVVKEGEADAMLQHAPSADAGAPFHIHQCSFAYRHIWRFLYVGIYASPAGASFCLALTFSYVSRWGPSSRAFRSTIEESCGICCRCCCFLCGSYVSLLFLMEPSFRSIPKCNRRLVRHQLTVLLLSLWFSRFPTFLDGVLLRIRRYTASHTISNGSSSRQLLPSISCLDQLMMPVLTTASQTARTIT